MPGRQFGACLPDVDGLSLTGATKINGVDVALYFDEETSSDRITCYMDIGRFDIAESEVMRSMLKLNLITGSKTSGIFALNPENGNALFVVQLGQPDRFDGNLLATTLRLYVEQAIAGREAVIEAAS